LGTSPFTDADTGWAEKSDPTDRNGVESVYTTGPPPEYFGSKPYSKYAVVGNPSGFTEPENAAAELLCTTGGPGITAGGLAAATDAVPVPVAFAPPASAIATLVACGPAWA
jgi:hypothetical protein